MNEFPPRNRARDTHFTTQYLRYGHGFILGVIGTPFRLGRRSGGYNQLSSYGRVQRKFPVVDSVMTSLYHEQISSRKSRLIGEKFTFRVIYAEIRTELELELF